MTKQLSNNANKTIPPLSPYLFMGLLARPILNKPLLDPIISLVARTLQKKHPRLVKALAPFAPADIIIDPTDLPLRFLMSIRKERIHISVLNDEKTTLRDKEEIAIKGSIEVLLQMIEGKLDGDALFFSRQLTIEGCMEVVVALRNVIEAEDIDLRSEFLSLFGPFKKQAGLLGRIASNTHQFMMDRLSSDIELIKDACINDVEKRCAYQDEKHDALSKKVAMLEKKLIASENKIRSMRSKIKA